MSLNYQIIDKTAGKNLDTLMIYYIPYIVYELELLDYLTTISIEGRNSWSNILEISYINSCPHSICKALNSVYCIKIELATYKLPSYAIQQCAGQPLTIFVL